MGLTSIATVDSGAVAPADALVGLDTASGQPVWLDDEQRPRGVTVLGKTGAGKTTLLEQLILQDIARGTSVVVIDAHGDLTQRIVALAPPAAEDRLLLLEAWEDLPFRLNLFDCPDPTSWKAVDRTVSGIVQVFKKLFGSPREFYPRLERDLGYAARTVLANGGTLVDVPKLFWDDEFRATALRRVTNPWVREFWQRWKRIGRPDRQMGQLESTINRLDQFLSSEFVTEVVRSTTTTIPFDEVLAGDGQVLLLNLPIGEIGEGLCNLLGSLFLAVLTERIFARGKLPPEERPRVHLYLDEYGRYATPTTAQLLTEGRKFGAGTTIAHQTRAQIPDEENKAAELQVGTLVFFQLIGADAAELAGELDTTPVRTKKVLRQRTISQYREWDEEVWDPPEAEHQYAELRDRLATLQETVGKALARKKLGYYLLEWAYKRDSLVTFDKLLAVEDTDRDVRVHLPFNQCAWSVLERGQTVGGLRRVGPPDFWAPSFEAELQNVPCEGYTFPVSRLHSNLRLGVGVASREKVSASYKEVYKFSTPEQRKGQPEPASVQEVFGALSDDEFRLVQDDLEDQVTALEKRIFKGALFWFWPYSINHRILVRHPDWEKDLRSEMAEEDEWLASTRPRLGQERGWRPWKPWLQLGTWQVTAFPEAVAWLKEWVRDAQQEIALLQAEYDRLIPPLREQLSSFWQAHRKRVHHRVYLGELPVKHARQMAPGIGTVWSRHYRPPVVREDQWYDQVEELDQTHADRRLELATQLTQLPTLTALCRTSSGTSSGQHEVQLPPRTAAGVDRARIDRVRKASKARFGRPPEEPPAPETPIETDTPGTRRLRRYHPDEE